MFEYVVILSDGTVHRIIAENISAVMSHFNEDEVTINNIFKHVAVSEVPKRTYKNICTACIPKEASETGCYAIPRYVEQLREGDTVAITAFAAEGWKFGHWEVDGNNVGNSPTMNVRVGNKDTVYKAVFKLID